MGMDDPENVLISTSKIAGAMNYPSTTQALFALIVMIIVLLFILVYCCWGTFSCARQEEAAQTPDEGANVVREIQGPGGRGNRMVIVPFSNMIYVGDPESRRIYEIPVEQDKPPAYTEVYDGVPPPPYSTENQRTRNEANSNSNNSNNSSETGPPDLPPSYEDCLSSRDTDAKWPEVLEALLAEQAKRELNRPDQTQSEDPVVTQLPALRMPSMMVMEETGMSSTSEQARRSFTENIPIIPLDDNTSSSITESEGTSITESDLTSENEQNFSSVVADQTSYDNEHNHTNVETVNLLSSAAPVSRTSVIQSPGKNEYETPLPTAIDQGEISSYPQRINSASLQDDSPLSTPSLQTARDVTMENSTYWTEEELSPSTVSRNNGSTPTVSVTSNSINTDDVQESNDNQLRSENQHSTQDYSNV